MGVKRRWKPSKMGGTAKRLRFVGRPGGLRRRRRYGGRRRRFGRRRIRVHSFRVKSLLTGIDPSNTAGEITRNYKFQMDSLGGLADYQNLFDLYKITGVKLEFRVRKQPGASYANASLPVMWSAVDYDGEPNVNVSVTKLLEREDCRITYFNDSNMYVKYFIRPRSLQQSVTFNETVNPPVLAPAGRYPMRARWQDLQQGASIPHFGLLVAVQGVGLATLAPTIDVIQTLYFKCKYQY